MTKNWQIPRRTVLRGLGTLVALPYFECMLPSRARGASASEAAPANRLAFWFVPNGVHMPDWTPSGEGESLNLPPTLALLEKHQQNLLVLSGLTHDKARANGDGGGDHARSAACFLTGCQPYKTHGANIRAGISVDQLAAAHTGQFTRLPSLELGCDRGSNAGNCDSGYSCAYSANISWRSPSLPMAKEANPRQVFERLFAGELAGETQAVRDKRARYHRSVLDFVREDAGDLRRRLGGNDQRKLDEYLASVRELETRITRAEQFAQRELPAVDKPEGIPKSYADHLRLMADLQVLAFQADLTRVTTFMLANEGSNRSYGFVEVPEGHHELSHHGGNLEKQAKIAKINRFHMSQFAYFLDRLADIREGEGTLLDHAMLVYGSGIGDGNAHNHDDLPIVVAGQGGGTLSTGRHVQFPKETPLANLWLALLDRMQVSAEKIGDSTGHLDRLL